MAGLPFDVQGARAAGYSDDQIVNELAQSGKVPFNFAGAYKAGHSSTDILNEVAPQPSGYLDNLKEGAGEFAEGVGNTLNKLGASNVGPEIARAGKSIEPANYVPTPIFDDNGKFNGVGAIGKTLARGAVPAAASILGAGLAAPLGGAAAIAGGAIPGLLSDTGNEIDKTGSVPRGIATSVAENAVSALPVGRFLGGAAPLAGQVGMKGVMSSVGRLADTAISQGLASGAGTAAGDLVRSGTVNPVEVANSAVGGAAGAAVFAGARKTLPEVIDALHYSGGGNAPEDIAARQMAANRVLQAAGGDRLQGRLIGNSQIQRNGAEAVNIARLGVNNDLSDAMADFNKRSALPNDAKTVLAAAMSGNLPNARGYATLAQGLGNDPQAGNVLNLVRQQQQLNLVGGRMVGSKLTGGAGGIIHSFLTPEHLLKTGLVGLLGAGEEGAGHVIAFSPATIGAAAGGGAALRVLDNITGAQAPAGRFTRNFASPGGATNVPMPVPQMTNTPIPAPGMRPGLPSLPPNSGAPSGFRPLPPSGPQQPWGPLGPDPNAVLRSQIKDATDQMAARRANTLLQKTLAKQQGTTKTAVALDALNGSGGGDAAEGQDSDQKRVQALARVSSPTAVRSALVVNQTAPAAPAAVPAADDLSIPAFLRRTSPAPAAPATQVTQQRTELEGRAAFSSGKTLDDNPWLSHTPGWNAWQKGWTDASALQPSTISKTGSPPTTTINGEEFAPSSYAHMPVDDAADAILKAANIGGKNIAFQGGYRAGIVNRLTGERAAMQKIAAEVPNLPAAALTARLEGTSSQTNAKAFRESVRAQYPHASAALDKYLSDDVIQGLWRKKGK